MVGAGHVDQTRPAIPRPRKRKGPKDMVLRPEERQRLARFDDHSKAAAAHRLRAARFVAGVSPLQISRSGRWPPDLAHVEAAEAGLVMPNYALEDFYRRRLGLPPNFFDWGEIANIPIEIEAHLFAALKAQIEGK